VAAKSDAPRPRPPEAPPPAREAAPYEFADDHKDSFRALAGSVSFVGVCTMLLAALGAVFVLVELYMGFIPNGIATAVVTGVNALMAWWMVSAGRSLSALVRTRGRDVDHLMEGVAHLRRLFGLWRVAIIVLAMLITAVAFAVVWCTFVVERGGRCFTGFG
jgi:hypothetical protein